MASAAKILIFAGLAMAALGVVLWGLSAIPIIGRLPGDIYIRRGNFSFYFPLTTCILISIVATILFALMRR